MSVQPNSVTRHWGYYTVLGLSDYCKVKLLVIKPGCLISFQRHRHRSLHWHVKLGTCIFSKSFNTLSPFSYSSTLHVNDSVDIETLYWHHVKNVGLCDLKIILIQYCKLAGMCQELDKEVMLDYLDYIVRHIPRH